MVDKPTYEELEQRVKELEKEPVRDSKAGYAHVWSTYSQSPIPILVLSKEGEIIDYNDAMAHLTGYTHEEIPDVTTWMPKIYPDEEYRNQVIEISERSRSREIDVKRDEFIITTKTGERRYINFSVFDILHNEKPTDLQIVQGEDVTEQKLAQEALKRAHDELERRVKKRTAELEKKNELLKNEIEGRKQAKEQIKASLKEKETLLRELYHRTKNNMQAIISMLHLQSQNIKDKKLLQIFKETENRIKSMALVHEKLYTTKSLSRIDLKEYIRDLLNLLMRSYKERSRTIVTKTNMESVSVTIDYAIPCGLIINELITNSLKHAFPGDRKGEIIIELNLNDDEEIEIRVKDDGVGLPTDFDPRKSGSYGLQSVISLTEHQLQGNLDLIKDKGAEFRIRFKETGYKERV